MPCLYLQGDPGEFRCAYGDGEAILICFTSCFKFEYTGFQTASSF